MAAATGSKRLVYDHQACIKEAGLAKLFTGEYEGRKVFVIEVHSARFGAQQEAAVLKSILAELTQCRMFQHVQLVACLEVISNPAPLKLLFERDESHILITMFSKSAQLGWSWAVCGVPIMWSIAKALSFLHNTAKRPYGYLNPSVVLVTYDGRPKLRTLLLLHCLKGSDDGQYAPYLAPEAQGKSKAPDMAMDMYAFGILTLGCILGRGVLDVQADYLQAQAALSKEQLPLRQQISLMAFLASCISADIKKRPNIDAALELMHEFTTSGAFYIPSAIMDHMNPNRPPPAWVAGQIQNPTQNPTPRPMPAPEPFARPPHALQAAPQPAAYQWPVPYQAANEGPSGGAPGTPGAPTYPGVPSVPQFAITEIVNRLTGATVSTPSQQPSYPTVGATQISTTLRAAVPVHETGLYGTQPVRQSGGHSRHSSLSGGPSQSNWNTAEVQWELDAAKLRVVGSTPLQQSSFGKVLDAEYDGMPVLAVELRSTTNGPVKDSAQLKSVVSGLLGNRMFRHPYLQQALGAVVQDGRPILVLFEHTVPNMSLRSCMAAAKEAGKTWSWDARGCHIAVGLCQALQFLHGILGLAHTAVSLESVLINDQGIIKLDSKGLFEPLEGIDNDVQDSKYMEPELLEGVGRYGATYQSDIYALGVCLAELLSGDAALSAEQVKTGQYSAAHAADEQAVRQLTSACMAEDPSQRPKIQSVVQQLQGYAERHGRPELNPAWWHVGYQHSQKSINSEPQDDVPLLQQLPSLPLVHVMDGDLLVYEEPRQHVAQGHFSQMCAARYGGEDVAAEHVSSQHSEQEVYSVAAHLQLLVSLAADTAAREISLLLRCLGLAPGDRGCSLVYEVCWGGSLHERLQRARSRGWDSQTWQRKFLPWAKQLAEALQHLHNVLLLSHNALTSHAVLLTLDNTIKMGGLGWCTAIKYDLKNRNRRAVLPEKFRPAVTPYTAPELAQRHIASLEGDIWSLGVILLELINRAPVAPQGPLPAVSETCPRPLAALISECLNTEPSKRPTAKDVYKRLSDRLSPDENRQHAASQQWSPPNMAAGAEEGAYTMPLLGSGAPPSFFNTTVVNNEEDDEGSPQHKHSPPAAANTAPRPILPVSATTEIADVPHQQRLVTAGGDAAGCTTRMQAEREALEGGVGGDFRVTATLLDERELTVYSDRMLGRGGFGSVCVGAFRGHECAVKTLNNFTAGMDLAEISVHLKSFLSEVEQLLKCKHPNLVACLGIVGPTFPYKLLYELCECDLFHALKGPNREEFAWRKRGKFVAYDIAKALHYLHHQRMMAHCDLKPQNVLLTKQGTAKLGDYGLVKSLKQREEVQVLTKMACSPTYAAPEMLIKGEISMAVDIYAFGIIVIELLTSQPSPPNRRYATVQSPEHPEDMVQLVQACMADDPEKRPKIEHVLTQVYKHIHQSRA